MYLVTPSEMAKMDGLTIKEFGVPGHTLMESAARGAVEVFVRHFKNLDKKKICVVCGKGNNGGDGLVMARYLAPKTAGTDVFLMAGKNDLTGDAALNLALFEKTGKTVEEIISEDDVKRFGSIIREYDIILDAIFGTGLNSSVTGIPGQMIDFMNLSKKPVFAVDIPSGLDAGTGRPLGKAIRADITATFGFPKIGHAVGPGASFCGITEIIDIGIPKHMAEAVSPKTSLITRKKISKLFSRRSPETHKGTNGHVLVMGGSPGKSGAASMTAMAALRTGAGLVTLAVPSSLRPFSESSVFEIMTEPLPETPDGCIADITAMEFEKLIKGKKVMAIGPGMDKGPETEAFLFKIMEMSDIPLVLDAGALNIIAENPSVLKKLKTPAVLTPHPGEMARLAKKSTAEIQEDRIGIATSFAKEYGIYLVLKGAGTVTASPQGKTRINGTGNPGLATAGTGDVLAGMIAGLISQGFEIEDAAAAGVYIHGKTADRLASEIGPWGFTATDLITKIPECLKNLVLEKENHDPGLIVSLESLF